MVLIFFPQFFLLNNKSPLNRATAAMPFLCHSFIGLLFSFFLLLNNIVFIILMINIWFPCVRWKKKHKRTAIESKRRNRKRPSGSKRCVCLFVCVYPCVFVLRMFFRYYYFLCLIFHDLHTLSCACEVTHISTKVY